MPDNQVVSILAAVLVLGWLWHSDLIPEATALCCGFLVWLSLQDKNIALAVFFMVLFVGSYTILHIFNYRKGSVLNFYISERAAAYTVITVIAAWVLSVKQII